MTDRPMSNRKPTRPLIVVARTIATIANAIRTTEKKAITPRESREPPNRPNDSSSTKAPITSTTAPLMAILLADSPSSRCSRSSLRKINALIPAATSSSPTINVRTATSVRFQGRFGLWLASWRRVAHGGILANPARKHNQSGHIGVTTRLRC